ncbi:GntR family transcriptional regulator [Micromonospora rubida]|uniref:GntR family transcriptional regulator n=1 Tax=Micromonospora rubida TaxID=2697657 RepID=UPI0038B30CB3
MASDIRAAIQSGRLAAGARVDSEASLSEQYGVARGTYRQALLILDREGLTNVLPGRGRYVASPASTTSLVSRAEEVARSLESEIRDGRLPPGAHLPGELTIAERFGIARSTARRALDILEVEGLVARLPGKTRTVLNVDPHSDGLHSD